MNRSVDEEQIEKISHHIRSDIYASDLRWSLFVAATESYRYDSVLRPFPAEFIRKEDHEKDIDNLRKSIRCIGPLESLLQADISKISLSSINLLHWVLTSGSFNLQSVSRDEFAIIKKLSGQVFSTPQPNYIFKVINSFGLQQFEKASAGRKTFYAYHGSSIQNFHSILHHGLIAHLNKNGLFGKGTYLSSELSVSLLYSPIGNGWNHSIFGPQLSCVAVCEILDHPDVKCQMKGSSSRQRSPDSLAGKVPDKYYLVQNNDVVCLRYLLVYNNPSKAANRVSVPCWWWRYRLWLLMISYIVVLIGIGLSTSRTLQQFLAKYFS